MRDSRCGWPSETEEQPAQLVRLYPRTEQERPELRELCTHLVEPHFVDELLELERVLREQSDAPLPVVEADGAADHLLDDAEILVADGPVAAHHGAALLHRQG